MAPRVDRSVIPQVAVYRRCSACSAGSLALLSGRDSGAGAGVGLPLAGCTVASGWAAAGLRGGGMCCALGLRDGLRLRIGVEPWGYLGLWRTIAMRLASGRVGVSGRVPCSFGCSAPPWIGRAVVRSVRW